MSFLVDANVLSETTKPEPNASVLAWMEAHDGEVFVSALTLGEIQKGISLYPNSRKRRALEKWFGRLMEALARRILPCDTEASLEWGCHYAALQKKGQRPPLMDSLLAATAKVHGLTVVTRNVKDMPGVECVNPWED
jgi:predicted nucleic acid-binding protein